VVLDMGEVTNIKAIEVNFMQQAGPWIWFPEYVDIYMSEDGENWRNVKHIDNDVPRDTEGLLIQNFGFVGNENCRYIRYTAHQLPKEGAYMFIDEIKIK
jgi:hexosaminidase